MSSIDFKVRMRIASGQGLSREDEVLNRNASDEMFLDDALQHVWSDGVIPGSIRIHDRDGALFANSQTVGLGAVNTVFALIEIQFLKSLLQVIPRFKTDFAGGTFRLCRIGAEKYMAADLSNAKVCGDFSELLFDVGTHEFYFALRVWSATLCVAAAMAASSPR